MERPGGGGVRVSVVTPVHNGARFLREALMSALAQTHRPFEVIVVDDGSTDDSAEIAAGLNHPAVRVISLPRGGVSRARNVAMAHATGELIAFLDADDLWDADKLDHQMAMLTERADAAGIGSALRYVTSTGVQRGVTGGPVAESDLTAVAAAQLMPFQLSSLVVRADAARAAGPFDEELDQAEDLDWLARLAAQGPILSVPRPLGAYRLHRSSASVQGYLHQRRAARFVVARLAARAAGHDLAWEDFVADERLPRAARRRDLGAYSFRRSGVEWADGRSGASLAHLLRAAVLYPTYTARRLWLQLRHRRSATPPFHGGWGAPDVGQSSAAPAGAPGEPQGSGTRRPRR